MKCGGKQQAAAESNFIWEASPQFIVDFSQEKKKKASFEVYFPFFILLLLPLVVQIQSSKSEVILKLNLNQS